MSQVTLPNVKIDQSKEKSTISPKLDESKIIFVNNYNKNRNLSKSFQLKLPYNKEKLKDFYKNFTEKSDINLKPILKNKLNKKSISDLNGEDIYRKKVRFLDEVYEEILEQETLFYQTNYKVDNLEKKDKNTENRDNKFSLNIENFLKIKNHQKIHENTDKIESDNNSENITKKNMNKVLNDKNLPRNISNKNLVEIIEVPSYRYYNIYRTNDKEFFEKIGFKKENNIKCKCCIIF